MELRRTALSTYVPSRIVQTLDPARDPVLLGLCQQIELDDAIARAKADAEAASVRERGAAEIAAARERASADLQAELGVKALAAAEAVVRENLDDAAQAQLVEDYINRVGA